MRRACVRGLGDGWSRLVSGACAVLLGGVMFGGCSGRSGSSVPACVPGAQVSCVCTNGANGAQSCRDDGSGYRACECSNGASGSAGKSTVADAGANSGGTAGKPGGTAGKPGGATGGSDPVDGAGQGGAAGAAEPELAGAGSGGDHPTGDALDFPEAPLFEADAPANAPALFGDAANFVAGALCVLEPELSAAGSAGAMFPSNWLRPRFRVAAGSFDLFEIRLHSAAEKHELVVYTTKSTWYLPSEVWQGKGASPGLAAAAAGDSVTVTIRALSSASPGIPVGVTGSFEIAPAQVSGSIVFYTTTSVSQVTLASSQLHGFSVGDEGVATVLGLPQLAWSGQLTEEGAVLRGYYDKSPLPGFVDGQPRCIGCHAQTPDGESLVFTDDWPWAKGMAQLTRDAGTIPSFLGKGASALLKMPWWGSQTMSAGHWQSGDRVLVTSYGTKFGSGTARTKAWQGLPSYDSPQDLIKQHQLAWIDLESTAAIDVAVTDTPVYGPSIDARNAAVLAVRGTAWGLITTGDSAVSDVSPSINAAGDRIVYVATDSSPEGHPAPTATTADLRVVPYGNRAGGVSKALLGAAEPDYFEYDPAFSPDGQLVSFTRAPTSGPDGPYHNRFGEVNVVSSEGGSPVPLAANSPNACASDTPGRGVINGSASFAPTPVSRGGKTYYFLVFTSARRYGDEFSSQFQIPQRGPALLPDSTQLYLATVVRDNASGAIKSFPAIYVWSQNRMRDSSGAAVGSQFANLTPTWSKAQLPPLTIAPAATD